jgi:phage shock protein PspC (stress-responsive transcriptional regulator)
MKKVVNAGIGGRSFTLDEDAYQRLNIYLDHFRQRLKISSTSQNQTIEVMDDLEARISELFLKELSSPSEVVNIAMVCRVTTQLGMPDGSSEADDFQYQDCYRQEEDSSPKQPKKLYRDEENKVIGGVASGLAAYLNLDITLVRVIMLALLFAGSLGFWLYILIWIIAPVAKTTAQKCEMRGWPVTAENMAKFSRSK